MKNISISAETIENLVGDLKREVLLQEDCLLVKYIDDKGHILQFYHGNCDQWDFRLFSIDIKEKDDKDSKMSEIILEGSKLKGVYTDLNIEALDWLEFNNFKIEIDQNEIKVISQKIEN